jgi:hypothetical protein
MTVLSRIGAALMIVSLVGCAARGATRPETQVPADQKREAREEEPRGDVLAAVKLGLSMVDGFFCFFSSERCM